MFRFSCLKPLASKSAAIALSSIPALTLLTSHDRPLSTTMPSQNLDSAIIKALNLSDASLTIKSSGGSGFANTLHVTAQDPSSSRPQHFFIKTGPSSLSTALLGEAASLKAIAKTKTLICPDTLASGKLDDSGGVYMAATFLNLKGGSPTRGFGERLATMHSAPFPEDVMEEGGLEKPMFGFPVSTCCGSTELDNTWTSSWMEFFADRRLRAIAAEGEKNNGPDPEFAALIEKVATVVAPALLSDNHLRRPDGSPITPSLVHGDLWSGNASTVETDDGMKDAVYDPAAFYAHAEFELGIMRMFGGFSGVEKDYLEARGGKDEPKEEFEDRVRLYEAWHCLNHWAIFGGGYKSQAKIILKDLVSKYGK